MNQRYLDGLTALGNHEPQITHKAIGHVFSGITSLLQPLCALRCAGECTCWNPMPGMTTWDSLTGLSAMLFG